MARNFHAAVVVPVVYCDYYYFANIRFLLERGTTEFVVFWKQFTVVNSADVFMRLLLFSASRTDGVCWILPFKHFFLHSSDIQRQSSFVESFFSRHYPLIPTNTIKFW